MDSMGEGEGGKIWENGIETCKMSCKKRVASPGSMHDNGCLGLVPGGVGLRRPPPPNPHGPGASEPPAGLGAAKLEQIGRAHV